MYGCLSLMAIPRTGLMWPVSVSLSSPDARSQTFSVLSPAPVTNHSFPGSTQTQRTHPRCPEITRISFHGACQSGLGIIGPPLPARTVKAWLAPFGLYSAICIPPVALPLAVSSPPASAACVSWCTLETACALRCAFASASSACAIVGTRGLFAFEAGSFLASAAAGAVGGGKSFTTSYSSRVLIPTLSFLGPSSSCKRAPWFAANISYVRFVLRSTCSSTDSTAIGPAG
mmetsp:Transcript_10937/g.26270  ORF Transcript_10937/g.26270 Transcript_10937/m.26270 type:complete len:230 (-) Transcript_10937:160-849(-)